MARTRIFRARWIGALATACIACACASTATAVEAGQAAPKFSAKQLGGRSQLSLEAYRGRVVYLDFWASWCKPCASSLPALDRLSREFSPEDFQVLAVNVDHDPALAKRFLKLRPVGYPSVSDPDGALPERFGVKTMPTAFLIDRDGVIRHVHRGFRDGDESELRDAIQKLVTASR